MSEVVDNEVPEDMDPFSPENIQILQYITLARIYDVMMVNLQLSNPEAANQVLSYHKAGHLLGPQPIFSGRFVADEPDTTADSA